MPTDPNSNYTGLLCIKLSFFSGIQNFHLPAAGLLSCSRLRGTQGPRLYTTVQVWVQAGLHGACSGRSKSRSLASKHGVAFRGVRADKDNGKPTFQLFFAFIFAPMLYSHAAAVRHSLQAFPVATATDTTYACVDTAYVCVCCVCVCVRACAGLCMRVLALGRASFGTIFPCWY